MPRHARLCAEWLVRASRVLQPLGSSQTPPAKAGPGSPRGPACGDLWLGQSQVGRVVERGSRASGIVKSLGLSSGHLCGVALLAGGALLLRIERRNSRERYRAEAGAAVADQGA